jgi:adenylylsulfate kinase-like enzyme
MRKVYITGVSGTGKTTTAKELQKRGFYVISIDEVDNLCSWIDQETGENHGGKEEVKQQIVGRYKSYADKMLALGAISINTEKSIDEVVNEVIKQALS